MDENMMAGVVGLQEANDFNGCDSAEAEKRPAKTAGNPEDCLTFEVPDPAENAAAFAAYYGIGRRRTNVIGLTMRFVLLPTPREPKEPRLHADVRWDLLKFARGEAGKRNPLPLVNIAEDMIVVIDWINDRPNEREVLEARLRDLSIDFAFHAKREPRPPLMPPAEIAKAFWLQPHRHQ